jgi:hypothetical protein
MKECPTCERKYDDTWGVCLKDSTVLNEIPGTATIKPDTAQENTCPFCKEAVKPGASRCPHCRESIGISGALQGISKLAFWLFVIFFLIPGLILAAFML